jgi:hypothetical protein
MGGIERSESVDKREIRHAPSFRAVKASTGPVGSLSRDLPSYVNNPPVESVVFGWGTNEDGQLVRSFLSPACCMRVACEVEGMLSRRLPGILCVQGVDSAENVLSPKVVEALLGTRFRGRAFGKLPLVCTPRCVLSFDGA